MTKRFGFTLAEVLITLGIIGVVAAMTIPTLMNQTGQAEFKTGFKKAMSVLNQAITMNVALNNVDFGAVDTNGNNEGSYYSIFTERMNVINMRDSFDGAQMGTPFQAEGNYILYFNDGMAITYPTVASACTQPSSDCTIVVDVNGTRKPNKLSLATEGEPNAGIFDEFVLDFYNQQVLPHDEKARYVLYN